MTRLPIVVQPAAGEALRSFVARTESANLLQSGTLAVPALPELANWQQLSEATSQPLTELRAMSWSGYPASILGEGRSTGWRLRTARWGCPRCLVPEGAWQRTWELACLPVCFTCNSVLDEYPSHPTPQQHSSHLRQFQYIRRVTEASRTSAKARSRLARMLRVARLLAVTSSADWPPQTSPGIAQQLNKWDYHPPSQPEALAHLIPYVVQLVCDPARERSIVTEAWQRLDHLERSIARTLLPKRPSTRRRSAARTRPSAANRIERSRGLPTRGLVKQLLGFDADLVPGLAPMESGRFLIDQSDWAVAQERALALHMLANPRLGGLPGWASQAQQYFLLPRTRPTPFLEQLQAGSIEADAAEPLLEAAAACREHAINFRQRRELLAGLRRAPRIPFPGIAQPLLRGWLWIYLTHGRITPAGPRWVHIEDPLPTAAVLTLHDSLTLEQRIRLADHADTFWAELTSSDLKPFITHQMDTDGKTATHARHA